MYNQHLWWCLCGYQSNWFLEHDTRGIFDVRSFHPSTPLYWNKELSALYRQHKNAKKQEYGARIHGVEWGVLIPLVLTTTDGMAQECTTFYKRLADCLADKHNMNYSLAIGWLRCRSYFAMLRPAIRAICGTWSSTNSVVPVDITLVSKDIFRHWLYWFCHRERGGPKRQTDGNVVTVSCWLHESFIIKYL